MAVLRVSAVVFALLTSSVSLSASSDGPTSRQVNGLITKPSFYSVDVTLDRFETSLKEHGFIIFTRLDHAAAAASFGLKMPRATVLVFGNPRIGTPNFLRHPTLAIDLPLKALVWEDAGGKVWLSYNSEKYLYEDVYARHGPPNDPELSNRIESQFSVMTDEATK